MRIPVAARRFKHGRARHALARADIRAARAFIDRRATAAGSTIPTLQSGADVEGGPVAACERHSLPDFFTTGECATFCSTCRKHQLTIPRHRVVP